MGQKLPNWPVRDMSDLPPLATELRTSREVRFVPRGDNRKEFGVANRYCFGRFLDTFVNVKPSELAKTTAIRRRRCYGSGRGID